MPKHLAPSAKRVSKTEKLRSLRERRVKEEPEAEKRRLPLLDALERARYLPIVLPALLLIAAAFLPLEGWMRPAVYAIPFLLAFAPIVLASVNGIRERRFLSNEQLTVAAGVLLFACGLYTEAVLLAILFGVSKLLEEYLLADSQKAMDKVLGMLPDKALVMGEDGPELRDPREVVPGDILFIPAGERIPVDGVIVEGITTVDTAAVSGQRSPWAVNVLKHNKQASESSRVPTGGKVEDHILYYAIDEDGDGITVAKVGNAPPLKIRASAAVWCAGADGKLDDYGVGATDDVYSWNGRQLEK